MKLHKYSVEAAVVLSVFLFIAAFGCMIAAFVIAGNAEYDGYADGFYYKEYTYFDSETEEAIDGIQLTRCDLKGDVNIPNTLIGKPVISIDGNFNGDLNNEYHRREGDYSFFLHNEGITSIQLPSTLREIGAYAFVDCTQLTNLAIPAEVSEIGYWALSGCAKLEKIEIPDGVKILGSGVFSRCIALKEMTIPAIGYDFNSLFEENFFDSNYDEVQEITDGMTIKIIGTLDIGDEYFAGCRAEEINIMGTPTKIGDSAFRDCVNISSVIIPPSVTFIGENAFSGCLKLQQVHISDLSAWCKIQFGNWLSTPLGETGQLFLNNSLVESIVIPNDVTKIGEYTFYNCSTLDTIVLPNELTEIGTRAFWACSNLKKIVIPNSVETIMTGAFLGCDNLTIYAEADSKPSGWYMSIYESYPSWNGDCPVVWGYKG